MPQAYFNRTDVQKVLHVPPTDWEECTTKYHVMGDDASEYPIYKVLPRVIERNVRTIIAQGQRDYLIQPLGTRLILQNMSWHGHYGFDRPPSQPFIVDGVGTTGVYEEERGLTYVEIARAGRT